MPAHSSSSKNQHVSRSLFLKVAVLCTLISFLSVGAGALLFLDQVEKSELARQQAEGRRLQHNLVTLTVQYVADETNLLERCLEICQRNSGINYIILQPRNGETMIVRDQNWTLEAVPSSLPLSMDLLSGINAIDPWTGDSVLHFSFPSEIASVPWGRIAFGLNTSSHEAAKAIALRNTAAGGAICGFIALAGAFMVARRITRPVAALSEMARRLADGELTARADIKSSGEIAELANSMNRMAGELNESHKLLHNRAEREHEVAKMNAEFLEAEAGKVDPIFVHALEVAATRLGAEAGSIFLYNENRDQLVRVWEWRKTPAATPDAGQYGLEYFPWLLKTVQKDAPLTVCRLQPLPVEALEERLFLESRRVTSLAAIQLGGAAKGAGILVFWSRNPDHGWTPDGLQFLRSVGSTLSNAVVRRDAARDRVLLQAQLLQAQKMEAVGKLSGGIAHDFNNMLVPIIGYSDSLLMNAPAGAAWVHEITEIKRAAESAASLTRQLLAFSRKQIISRNEIDLNQLVLTLKKMLHRLIGENVELSTRLSPDAWTVSADAGQIEQCLVNLCVNARHAIPNTGTITLRTCMVSAADIEGCPPAASADHDPFLRLSVSDTGCGMSQETLDRIFEPFYSTKGSDGTGLGLSVVHGIMEQHGGWINVSSIPGEGTTFDLYFPAMREAVPSVEVLPVAAAVRPARGAGQTIMLVEDEAGVLAFVSAALRQNGYQVISADCGSAARKLFAERFQDIDLVMSDVVLPDASGVELMEEFLLLQPDLKILMSSGYSERNSLVDLVRTRGLSFLHKPYTLTALLAAVRETLSGSYETVVA